MFFYQLLLDGGAVMWLIVIAALIASAVFVIKTFQFHREEINAHELINGLENVLKRDGFVEAISLCDNTPGPVARVVGSAILAFQRGDKDLQQAVDAACLEEVPRLERYVGLIGTVGYIAPLLGFFGTILGMMEAFQTIHQTQSVYLSAGQLSGAVHKALITTAAGLAVAIPCYVAYNYLTSRIHTLALDIELASTEMLGFFERRRGEKGNQQ